MPRRTTRKPTLKKLTQRLDASETAQREILGGSAQTLLPAKPEAKAPDPFASSPDSRPSPRRSRPPFDAAAVPRGQAAFRRHPGFVPAAGSASGLRHGGGVRQPSNRPRLLPPACVEPPPTVDSYLSAARRSARAASQAEAERSATGLGGFGWNVAKSPRPRSGRSLYLGIGVLALVAIAVIAGVVLNHRTAGEARPNSAIGALFQKKPAPPPIKTETLPVEDDVVVPPTASAATISNIAGRAGCAEAGAGSGRAAEGYGTAGAESRTAAAAESACACRRRRSPPCRRPPPRRQLSSPPRRRRWTG